MNQTTNIDSINIWVYPVAERNWAQAEGYDYLGRLNFESNKIKQLTNITDYSSFVVSGGERIKLSGNTLIINPGKFVINGYSVELKNAMTILLSEFISQANYWVYLKLKTKNNEIVFGSLTIDNIEIDGIDNIDTNEYTGIELIVSTNSPIPNEDNHILVLGIISYSQSMGWNILAKNTNIQNKLLSNNMSLTLDNSYTDVSSYIGTKQLEQWLTNDFMINDGELN